MTASLITSMDVIVYTMHFLIAKKVTLALLFPLATPAAAAPAPSQAKPKEGKTNPKLSSSPHTTPPLSQFLLDAGNAPLYLPPQAPLPLLNLPLALVLPIHAPLWPLLQLTVL